MRLKLKISNPTAPSPSPPCLNLLLHYSLFLGLSIFLSVSSLCIFLSLLIIVPHFPFLSPSHIQLASPLTLSVPLFPRFHSPTRLSPPRPLTPTLLLGHHHCISSLTLSLLLYHFPYHLYNTSFTTTSILPPISSAHYCLPYYHSSTTASTTYTTIVSL